MSKSKLYVLIRRDLTQIQQAVQGGHAVAEYLLRGPETAWQNGTIIYLGVKDEDELNYWGNELEDWVGFSEPDLNNELTTIALISKGEDLKELKLL